MSPKFKDYRCFGGWLCITYSPKLVVWWTTDACPPDYMNKGFYIIGNRWKFDGML